MNVFSSYLNGTTIVTLAIIKMDTKSIVKAPKICFVPNSSRKNKAIDLQFPGDLITNSM